MAASIVVLTIFTAIGCVADKPKHRIVTGVAKGQAEFIDHVKEIGYYAMQYNDCYAEIGREELSCPDQNVLTAMKIEVEDNSGEVNIIITETVVGTVYGGNVPANNHWRITIARQGPACRPGSDDIPQLPELPALVTLYTACFPLDNKLRSENVGEFYERSRLW